MRTIRALLVVIVGLALFGAACGSSGESKAEIQTKVKANWEKFFDPSTPTPQRAALLQNAATPKIKAIIAAQADNPQAKAIKAKVNTVTPKGDDKADVKYDLVSTQTGVPVLPGASGQAVKVDGKWKVSQQTFCTLIKLGAGPGC
jgi:hypothetical protein